jgi:hypothetical protein
MPAKKNTARRKLHALDLLCRAGAGIAPIAPAACRQIRELVGADAASIFWLDENGLPQGFFHEDSPDSARDLFVNEFERLFIGPAELNVTALARTPGPRVGRVARPDKAYFSSNTYNLLVRESGHHHSLDLRIDIDGRARAVVLLFRGGQRAFETTDAAALEQVTPYLQQAIASPVTEQVWNCSARRGHMLVDVSGERLAMLDEDAELLLKMCTLVGQEISLCGPIRSPPRVVRELCAQLQGRAIVRQTLPIPGGRLEVTARRLMAPAPENGAEQVLVTLELEEPRRLETIDRVLALDVSPLQQKIAFVAALGGSRGDSLSATGISNEALKKHLAAIYAAAGVDSWEKLTRELNLGRP